MDQILDKLFGNSKKWLEIRNLPLYLESSLCLPEQEIRYKLLQDYHLLLYTLDTRSMIGKVPSPYLANYERE